jgi:predicted alpha/beta superfamily hydrolase
MPNWSIGFVRRCSTRSIPAMRATSCFVAVCIAGFGLSLPGISCAAQGQPKRSDVEIKFVVFTPNDDSEADSIYCSMSIDNWPAGGRPMNRIAQGIYSQTMTLPASSKLKYKFLREQNWKTVENTSTGEDVRNRRLSVDSSAKKKFTIVHVVDSWADVPPQDNNRIEFPSSEDTSAETHTGEIRAHRQIHSTALGNRRDVLVWLPPGYDSDSQRRYPVLYMLDGQNVFNEATSFKGDEWQADETATRLVKQGLIEPLIIVAVYHTPNRDIEHTPLFEAPEKSRVDDFLRFLTNQIKPLIDKEYRTRIEPESNVLVGSSYGGLFSLYAACHAKAHFGGYAVISPSFQIEKGRIVEHVAQHVPDSKTRLWVELSAGSGLERIRSLSSGQLATARRLRDSLNTAGFASKNNLHYLEIEGAFHEEEAWAGRMEPLLKYFFPAAERKRKKGQERN